MKKINFVFFGTPEVASDTLEILKEHGFLPSLIITSPDAPKGRGLLMQVSPVTIFAEKNNIPCLKPEKLENIFTSLPQVDLFIVVAYGKIIPENILIIPNFGSINIHYSLLPKYRGASPVESAILNGDIYTGVTIQKMVYKMDAGNIIAQEKIEILPEERTSDLRKRLIKIGGELLVKTLPDFMEGKIKEIAQNENEATHCKKIKKEDGLIDLEGNATENYNKFRAYATWPRTFFFKNGKRIIIIDAELKDGKFTIKKILPEGKKEIQYENSIYEKK